MGKVFKLVFLEENEEYLTDAGCVVNVVSCNKAGLGPDTSFSVSQLIRSGEFRGRMRIGSHAIYLDLESLDEIIKVPFKQFVGAAKSMGDSNLVVCVNGLSAIPTVAIGEKTRLFKPVSTVVHEFEISIQMHASLLPDIAAVLGSLFRARNDAEERSHYVSSLLANSVVPFDLTSLASHREVLLLPSPMHVVRIKKMLEINGLLQVSHNYIYFQAIPNLGSQKLQRFDLGSLEATNLLKYKLKNTGIEFAFATGKKLFLLFGSVVERDLCLSVLRKRKSATLLPPVDTVCKLWVDNKISNFDYLMYLNWASGRSLNDIGQYPVFPWTLRNLNSAGPLNLEDPLNYRDFSLPVAASNPGKLAQCKERAEHMAPHEKFLFGSFYSNPAFVLYFLLRRFPECHLRLHGGHFDHSARLFTSLQTSWEAATMELIPEFFYQPNLAKSWLQNPPAMRLVPEVALPPWANNDPCSFVTTMRASLESKHVSAHLNEWIDLVFGVKSRGTQICLNANNLFHPICYLTDVDSDVKRYCLESETTPQVAVLQSQEFGHVPKQLFLTDSHPKRNLDKFVSWQPTEVDWKTAILKASEAMIVVEPVAPLVVEKRPPVASRQLKLSQTGGVDLNETVLTDSVFFGKYSWAVVTEKGHFIASTNRTRWRLCVEGLTCVAFIKDDIFVCGDVHGSLHLVSPTEGLLKSVSVHLNSVTCIAVKGSEIISGSTDQSLCISDSSTLETNSFLDAHSFGVTALAVASVGILSGDAKGSLVFWESRIAPKWTSVPSGSKVQSIDICPDGTTAVVIDAALTVWDVSAGSILWQHQVSSLHSALAIDAQMYLVVRSENKVVIESFRLSKTQFNVQSAQTVANVTLGPRLKRTTDYQSIGLITQTDIIRITDIVGTR